MAVQLADLNGRRLDIIGKIAAQSIAATGTFAIFTTPSGTYAQPGGAKLTGVAYIVLDNPTSTIVPGNITASFGSGATATDFAGSGSVLLPTAALATVIGAAPVLYAIGLVINFKITGAGTGGCDVTVLGWTE